MSFTFAVNGGSNAKVSFFLLEIAWPDGTWRLCNADIDLQTVTGTYDAGAVPGAHVWAARANVGGRYFQVKSISAGIATSSGLESILMDNADNVVSAILFASSNPAGSVVKVYEALFDPANIGTNKPNDVKLRLLRRVSQINLKPDPQKREAEITLDPYLALPSIVMARRHLGPKCTFIYKEPNSCQATGTDTSCDRTLTACSLTTKVAGGATGGNRLNFGGFTMITAGTP